MSRNPYEPPRDEGTPRPVDSERRKQFYDWVALVTCAMLIYLSIIAVGSFLAWISGAHRHR